MKIIALITAVAFAHALPVWADPETYRLDRENSRVGFSWFLGSEENKGQMAVKSAALSLDFERLANSQVSVAVDVTKARAGFAFATQGLKSRQILWADRFPTINFVSKRFRRNGDGALVDGDITIRGVTRPITLNASLFRPAGADPTDRSKLTIRLNGSVSRAAFGADGFSDLAGDEVKIRIVARIVRAP